jgi:hypothetical protein
MNEISFVHDRGIVNVFGLKCNYPIGYLYHDIPSLKMKMSNCCKTHKRVKMHFARR